MSMGSITKRRRTEKVTFTNRSVLQEERRKMETLTFDVAKQMERIYDKEMQRWEIEYNTHLRQLDQLNSIIPRSLDVPFENVELHKRFLSLKSLLEEIGLKDRLYYVPEEKRWLLIGKDMVPKSVLENESTEKIIRKVQENLKWIQINETKYYLRKIGKGNKLLNKVTGTLGLFGGISVVQTIDLEKEYSVKILFAHLRINNLGGINWNRMGLVGVNEDEHYVAIGVTDQIGRKRVFETVMEKFNMFELIPTILPLWKSFS